MGIRDIRTDKGFASVGTSRYYTIATNVSTQIILGSGYTAVSVFNHGSASLIWGDSGIAVNSGNYLYESGRLELNNLQDGWSIYLRADSVQTLVSVTEYRL